MALDDEMAILGRVEMFAVLSDEERRHLAFAVEPVRGEAGRILFRAGQSIDAAYVLSEGQVRLETPDGHVSHHDAAGTLFGETGLIHRSAWQSTATLEEPSVLLRLSRPVFRRLLEEYPASARALQAHFAKRIRDVATAMEQARTRKR